MEFGLFGVNGRTALLSCVVLEIERAPGHVTLLRRQVAEKIVKGSQRGARDVIHWSVHQKNVRIIANTCNIIIRLLSYYE